VSDDFTAERCNQRHQHGAIGSQRIDDVGFLILAEGTSMHFADRQEITWLFGPYLTGNSAHAVRPI
jgi:hypothetical protein